MISLLVVNYRSARLAAAAVASARTATSAPLQVVIVDNSLDPAEAEALKGCEADALIVSATNRGYAGGINDGRRACDGRVIVIANPDVVFSRGSIDALAAEISGRNAAAGPALFWDDAHRWHLPPGDRLGGLEKLDEVLASRSARWAGQRDLRRIRRRIAFWSLETPAEVDTLSGAVLAVSAEQFDAVGGFDERFALYFEETDFLRRLGERRLRIVHVPGARVRHIYNQSAGQAADDAGRRYAESERRYLEKWNGPFVARLLKRLERPVSVPADLPCVPVVDPDGAGLVVEASPLPSFATAAGCLSGSSVPPEVLASLRGRPLYLRALERDSGREVGRWMVESG